jgi:peptidoglycan/xylan/chitin deacetylase (PgdA/CDA1 family)
MSWDQLRELHKAGVTIGSQTATHLHMPHATDQQNKVDLEASNTRFKAELGFIPKIIAYPYGEYSLAVGKVTKAAGFDVGFGQHSGAIYKGSDFLYLPRFAFNEAFGDIQRFRLAIRALPFKVSDLTPADPYLKNKQNPPPFGFTVDGEAVKRLSRIACYATRQGKVNVERLGERRIEVRAPKAFSPGRTRMNCTLLEKNGRWRWLGMQYLVPKPKRN